MNINWESVGKLEEWAKIRYLTLVEKLGDKEFTTEEAEDILYKQDMKLENIGKLFSALRDAELILVKENPQDSRKNIYRFKLLAVTKQVSKKIDKGELLRLLKRAADLIRTAVDYRILLLFLFYKSISDRYNKIAEGYRSQGYGERESYVLANSEYIKLYDEEENKLYTWHEVTKSVDTIKELANALTKISNMNDKLNDLKLLSERLGLYGYISDENARIIYGLVQLFNSYDFADLEYDALGDGYQWILSYFAPTRAKEGEVYTPHEVIKLIVDVLDVENGSRVLDPACGSGGMLIEVYNRIKKKGEEPDLLLVGQERNDAMVAIAKLNMILRGIENFIIYNGDSLGNPQFDKADYVIANPPWNLDYNEDNLKKDNVKQIYNSIVPAGYTPRSSADWAWVELMLYYAEKKVGVILDQGALFRGGKERSIREGIVRADLLEAVILLPEKLFYNTSASGIIMVFNKNKSDERKGKIAFIDASSLYIKHPEVRKLNRLSDENIEKIVQMYREFRDVPNFAKVVDVSEIEKNGFNLNVSLYVKKTNEEEKIDVVKEFEELKELEKQRQELLTKVENYISEVKRLNG
ncbi:MAG: N-6 DNA methylase [Nitrososphaeria archaeon]